MKLENEGVSMKVTDESLFNTLEIGERIKLPVLGKWVDEIFVGFNEWYPGCKPKYQKVPTTIYKNEQSEIIERKILDYGTLKQDPRIISESSGSVLKKIDPSSELSKNYKEFLEANKK